MNWIKRLLGKKSAELKSTPPSEQSYNFQWHDASDENPFPVRILDVRSFTQTIVATTRDKNVAEIYVRLRQSDGRELKDLEIAASLWTECELSFPHDGTPLEGHIVFKAPSMAVKWDIYLYAGCFLFARSWTGELKYRARMRIEPAAIVITAIECAQEDADLAESNVYFLLATHAMRRVLPHRLPAETPKDPMTMATLSFSLFGNLGCYATFDDITKIPLSRPA